MTTNAGLANTFRRVLDIQGTPIRMEFRQGDNPSAKEEIRHSSKDAPMR